METKEQVRSIQEAVQNSQGVHRNLSVSRLVEEAIRRGESVLTDKGALCSSTGQYTGRSPKDKFFVDEPSVHHEIDWGNVNQPLKPENFARLYQDVLDYVQSKNWFVFDGFAGADAEYRLPIQVVNEYAWHNLFAHQLFIRPTEEELQVHQPAFTILSAPGFFATPSLHGTRSETFIVVSFEHRVVLIGGTEYAGEIKKSVFTLMNYLLPQKGVLPMHCSANIGQEGDVSLFFGLSGTGKTTLSTDPLRRLIGDDEHAWSKNGVFNIEGGCYAKCINLSEEKEPQIYNAIQYGAVLENVVLDDETRVPDYDDATRTENTRAAYPLDFIPGAVIPSVGGHPSVILFLTADAYGVLPPIAKLNKEQAMYHFLSGYTSKLAGTERGVTTPEATFSTCFGAPFFPLRPDVYAEMLGKLMEEHGVQAYLVNTGWYKGPYGVGERMKLTYTRAMVTAAVNGQLGNVETVQDGVFGLHMPTSCPGVPEELLLPRSTWSDVDAYDTQAKTLAARFVENFKRFPGASEAIRAAGPKVD